MEHNRQFGNYVIMQDEQGAPRLLGSGDLWADVPRAASVAGDAGGAEGHPGPVGRGAGGAGALPPGRARAGEAQSPAHRAAARFRRGGRPALLCDGVLPRRRFRGAGQGAGAALDGGVGARGAAVGERAGVLPSRRLFPSRPETVQRDADGAGGADHGEAHRLRPRAHRAAGGARRTDDRGDAALRQPGAIARRGAGRAQRSLFAGDDALASRDRRAAGDRELGPDHREPPFAGELRRRGFRPNCRRSCGS